MIILDTNVVSDPLRPAPNPAVIAWLDAQVLETLYLSTVSVTELRYGIAVLPDGKRKESLRARIEEGVLPSFESRILPFDLAAAESCADIRARLRSLGQGIGIADSYIAATAAIRSFTVATRDTRPFEAAGLSVINPWETG